MNPLTRTLTSSVVILSVLGTALPSIAFAEGPAEYPPYRVRYKRKVVVVRPPPPPRRVRRVERVEYTRTVERSERRQPKTELLGIGLRFNGVGLDGNKLGLSDVENPAMGGIGLQLRSRIDGHWGLELSADLLHAENKATEYKQTVVPVMLSALFHFFPKSSINPYILGGLGVHFTNLSYLNGQFEHHILEFAGQAGFGLQVKLGKHFAVHTDLRFLSVYKNLGSVNRVSNECLVSNASGTKGFCDGLQALDPTDKFNVGAQFQGGFTYYF